MTTRSGAAVVTLAATLLAACGGSSAPDPGGPVCNWTSVRSTALTALPDDGTTRGGAAGTPWTFAELAGRTAFQTGSDWMLLGVPSKLAAPPEVFAVEADFYVSAATLGASEFRNIGLYALADVDPVGNGLQHGVWAGFRQTSAGDLFQWVVPPATPPAGGWDAWDQGLQVVAQSTSLALPTDAWHTLRVEGVRSACRFRALLDGVQVSGWSPGACDLGGTSVVVASGRLLPLGVGYSSINVQSGSSSGCVP